MFKPIVFKSVALALGVAALAALATSAQAALGANTISANGLSSKARDQNTAAVNVVRPGATSETAAHHGLRAVSIDLPK